MIIIDLIWFAFIGKGANLLRIGWLRVKGQNPQSTQRAHWALRIWEKQENGGNNQLMWPPPRLSPHSPSCLTDSSPLLFPLESNAFFLHREVSGFMLVRKKFEWETTVIWPKVFQPELEKYNTSVFSGGRFCHCSVMSRGKGTAYSSLRISPPSELPLMLIGSLQDHCIL